MKSFPSTANESQNMYGSGKALSYESTFDIDRLSRGSLNLNKTIPVLQTMLRPQNINAGNFNAYKNMISITPPEEFTNEQYTEEQEVTIGGGELGAAKTYKTEKQEVYKDKVYYENPLMLPAEIIALAKDYDWVYNVHVKEIANVEEQSGNSLKVNISNTRISPSMFNPMYGVSTLGIIRNTPLLNDAEEIGINEKISDCSIRMLCSLSKQANSELGMARYKYADFMYCKNLGKIPNNHLITLRKFAHPVADHIFEMSSPKYIKDDHSFETEGDVGRLITWFGTDENKLEDIIKFSYHATWVEKNAEIQEDDSMRAEDESTGIVGFIGNSFNPIYTTAMAAGQVGKHSLWGWLGSKLTDKVFQGVGKNNGLLRNYDNNKVYTPKNTIQSTHLYEGKLEFTHEFTLNFSYELRAYDNINPRSAFLDLIGNILEVTYRRGKFWGGSRKIIGPPQNESAFKKVNDYIDNAWDRMGGIFRSLFDNGISLDSMIGAIGSIGGTVGNILNQGKQAVQEALDTKGQSLLEFLQKNNTVHQIAEAAKGMLKNSLGRPTMYAWNSILDGSPTGLWHVTIGNPRNPIMAIGNLILTNATITQSGPLGIDDFPSELKVSVTLKHARPRDVTEIGRMYTKGAAGIYHIMAHHELDDFWSSKPAPTAETPEAANNNKKTDTDQNKVPTDGSHKTEELKNESPQKDVYSNDSQYQHEVNMAANANGYYNNVELNEDLIPNPFLQTDEHVSIMRKNNYSDKMLKISMEEVA